MVPPAVVFGMPSTIISFCPCPNPPPAIEKFACETAIGAGVTGDTGARFLKLMTFRLSEIDTMLVYRLSMTWPKSALEVLSGVSQTDRFRGGTHFSDKSASPFRLWRRDASVR